MKFKTKIWMLPIGAAVIFTVGIVISALLGARMAYGIEQLRSVDDPFLRQIMVLDRDVEQLRLTLQAAAAEGDADKLNDVEPMVDGARQALAAMQKLDGKQHEAQQLSAAFEDYQGAALAAIRNMLGKGPGDRSQLLTHMQSAQAELTKQLIASARMSDQCRLLSSIPGVGVVTASSFIAAIEDPENFRKSRSVGAWVGLTTRRYQSGEVDYDGHISRRGDNHLRSLLYEAAVTIMKACPMFHI